MIFGVLYVDTSRKFRKNPRFWEKSISINFRKFRKYFYRGGVTPPQYLWCICPNGLISTKIFALALTVLEIFPKTIFEKLTFLENFQNFFIYSCPLSKIFTNFWFKFFKTFCLIFKNVSICLGLEIACIVPLQNLFETIRNGLKNSR